MNKFVVEGKIVDVIQKEIFEGKLHIEQGKIVKVERCEVANKQHIIPGFIDAHVHVESSMLIPSEFARLAVVHGSVATISDPHEIGNVCGVDGVKYMIQNGKKVPFKFYFGAPSCVPATDFETAGARIDEDGIEELMAMDEINYLVMKKLAIAKKYNKVIDGHAPGLRGEEAKKYIDAGISTDHECFTAEEALDKLKHGMKILIREGSAAKNFEALIDLMHEHGEMMMFCSDDKHPNDLVEGHINQLVLRALARGIDFWTVMRAASKNVIEHYSMDVGLLQEGHPADFVIVEDVEDFKVKATYINGEKVAENGQTLIASVDEKIINNFNCHPIQPEDIQLKAAGSKVRVIDVEDGQLITKESQAELQIDEDGFVTSDVSQDVLKMVVVNRYNPAPPAIAFVRNFGLQSGALASSVGHDSHNIIAVGIDDADIVKAVNLIIAEQGGVSLATSDEGMIVSLPVAGLMSAESGYKVADDYEKVDIRSKELGVTLHAPYMTLSFLALLVIPELKLSDKGLFDGNTFSFTDVFL